MKRYRIIQKDAICDDVVMTKQVGAGFDEDGAKEALMMFQATYPDSEFVLVDYDFDPDGHHLDRDSDLH